MSHLHARFIPLAVLLAVSACATANPDRSLSRGEPEQGVPVKEVPVQGSVALVQALSGQFTGEILAVDEQTLWLRVEDKEVKVKRAEVQSVEIELHPSHAGATGVWTGLGAVSTLSHGFGLIYSAPLWVIAGSVATASAARGNHVVLGPSDLDMLAQYARFPQGIPEAAPASAKSSATAQPPEE